MQCGHEGGSRADEGDAAGDLRIKRVDDLRLAGLGGAEHRPDGIANGGRDFLRIADLSP